jgi:hypothetical protein
MKSNPDLGSLKFDEVLEAFHVCHIHLKPLHSVNVPIRKELYSVSLTRDAESQISQEAFYSIPFMTNSPAWGDATHLSVDHCDECVKRRREIESGAVAQ